MFKSKKILTVIIILIGIWLGVIIFSELFLVFNLNSNLKTIKNSDNFSQEFSRRNGIQGMSIEKFYIKNGITFLETTGGIFEINFKEGIIKASQKIGIKRSVVRINVGDNWFKNLDNPIREEFDYIWENNKDSSSKMIISGDSVIRFFNIKSIEARLDFSPIHQKINNSIGRFDNGGLLALDAEGGLAITPPSYANNEKWPKSFEDNVWKLYATEPLPMLFVGILPPRPFDWERSFMSVIHYSSHTQRYPTDEQIIGYSKYAKVLEMHSWVWQNRHRETDKDEKGEKIPLWVDYSFWPQNGKWIPDNELEFRRVIGTAHRYGMKVLPYVSLETDKESIESHAQEIIRLKETYGIDGVYIDGIFLANYPEDSYNAARNLREIFGNDGWLTLHDSHDSGYWAPFVNSYMDLIVTSEHNAFDRWTSTSYKISNSIATIWPEVSLKTADEIDFLRRRVDESLQYNNRLIFMAGKDGQWRDWRLYFTSEETDFMKKYYLNAMEKIKNNPVR